MTQAVPAARLEGVTHRYGRVLALDGLTLEIPSGRMIGVIGPDGVGKSTLLALVAGVRAIQAGTVRALDGDMSVEAERAARRGRIAYMPQGLGRNLYPTLSVFGISTSMPGSSARMPPSAGCASASCCGRRDSTPSRAGPRPSSPAA